MSAKHEEAKKIKNYQAAIGKQLEKARKKFADLAKKAGLDHWPKLEDLPKVGAVSTKISAEQAKSIREPAKRRAKVRKAALANPEVRKARKELKRAQRATTRTRKLLATRTKKAEAAPAAAEAPAAS
ncbi:MAG: hypothetical protein KIT79_06650 [Deltaproteobacteria bacterium]|nr:hypothetical protein [Deltaproteobacteria bacterium]